MSEEETLPRAGDPDYEKWLRDQDLIMGFEARNRSTFAAVSIAYASLNPTVTFQEVPF